MTKNIIFLGLLCPTSGDGRQQLDLHDPGIRRRRHDGRHGHRHRRHQKEERQTPAPPGMTRQRSPIAICVSLSYLDSLLYWINIFHAHHPSPL